MSNLREAAANKDYLSNRSFRIYPHGFFRVDAQWAVACWNREAEKLLMAPAISIVGDNLWKKFAAVIPLDFYTLYHKSTIKSIPMGGHFE